MKNPLLRITPNRTKFRLGVYQCSLSLSPSFPLFSTSKPSALMLRRVRYNYIYLHNSRFSIRVRIITLTTIAIIILLVRRYTTTTTTTSSFELMYSFELPRWAYNSVLREFPRTNPAIRFALFSIVLFATLDWSSFTSYTGFSVRLYCNWRYE